MEIIAFVVSVAGFGIAYLTYVNTYKKEPEEDKIFLLRKYDDTETATNHVISELKSYMSVHDCNEQEFMQGLTFNESVTFSENAYYALFNEKHRCSILDANIRKKQMDELIKRLDVHRAGIEDIRTHLKLYFKKDFTVSRVGDGADNLPAN